MPAARADQAEGQRNARTKGSHAGIANLGLPPTVGIALALHSVVMQQVKLTGSKHAHAAAMQQKWTVTHTSTGAHTHKYTHAQAHTCTDTHAQAHTRAHTHTYSLEHPCTHTHTHTL